MHILFLSHYFPPEFNAPANRTYEHTGAWVRQPGVRVTVVTNHPNHPNGKLFPGFRNRWLTCYIIDGVTVRRVKTFLAPNAGFFRRTLNYLFFVPAGILGSLGAQKVDVVVATSPQFFCALTGLIVSWLKRRPFIFELRDIWPESIVTVGAMPAGLAVRLLEKMELFLYRCSSLVVALTDAFKDNLIKRGIDPEKIVVIPNGVDIDMFKPIPRPTGLAESLGLQNHKVISYIGTLGMAHALDKVVDVAQRLNARKDLMFLLVGDGSQRKLLKQKIAKLQLENIKIMPPVPREEVVNYYALSDITLVTLRDQPLFDDVLPSKMLEMLAMGRPVLASVGRYSRDVLERSGGGVSVPPEDVEAMATAIICMLDEPHRLQEMGQRGHSYIKQHYNRKKLAGAYLELLHEVAQTDTYIARGRY